jgi:hypothetical protein
MATVIPTKVTQVDDRAGNHFEIFEVKHVTTVTTDVAVPDSAIGVAILGDVANDTIVAQEATTLAGITIRNQTSGASGLGFGDWAAGDGMKQVTIHADVASGTYQVVVRLVGSAGGTASTTQENL